MINTKQQNIGNLLKQSVASGLKPSYDKYFKYQFDANAYVQDVLKLTAWSSGSTKWDEVGQYEVLDYYSKTLKLIQKKADIEESLARGDNLYTANDIPLIKNWIRIEAGHSIGKCVDADDNIILANGLVIKAKDLVGKNAELPDIKGKNNAIFFDNGIKEVVRITLENGVQITRTLNHPVWATKNNPIFGKRKKTSRGEWVDSGNLTSGHLVACIDTLQTDNNESNYTDDQIKLIALLLGDGCLQRTSTKFSCANESLLSEFIDICKRLGYGVNYINRYDYSITGSIHKWLKSINIYGDAYHKTVPDFVLQSSKRQKSLFLKYLFSTDGWYTQKGIKEIGYCSVNYDFVLKISLLLKSIGIHSNIYYKKTYTKGAYQLQIHRWRDVIKFCECVDIAYKDKSYVYEWALSKQDSYNNNFRKDRPDWRAKNAPDNTLWIKVNKVEYLGLRPTVGISVPTTNTFTTFIYEHNTNLASMIVSHFFDCFVPSIGLCYAPTYPQVNDLLFKEIRKWRTKNQLQGTILKKPEMYPPNEYKTGDWWVKGKAVGDNTESIQGQHEGYMLFILDEAEGLPQYLYDAVLSMASGGWAIVVLLANPRTTISPFYEIRQHNYVQNFRISCLNHPNVRLGYEKIKGATTRTQVLSWLYGTKCKTVEQHDINKYTFKLDWHDPDKIYLPTNDFLFRVMGIAPPHLNYDSFFNLAQVENIIIAESEIPNYVGIGTQKQILQIGIDVARHGDDFATIYSRYGNIVRCENRMQHSELHDFKVAIEEILSHYTKEQIEHVSIRVDATGIGWFLIDYLNMADFEFDVFIHPIQNNETAVNVDQFYDTVTEMYALAGEEEDIKVIDFGYANTLQFDLVNRTFGWITRGNREVKKLNKKELFKKKHKHSPDDSDGYVLAVVPDDYFSGYADFGLA